MILILILNGRNYIVVLSVKNILKTSLKGILEDFFSI